MSYMNRMGNAHNIYQTAAKRVLAVCSAGLLRSPTMANVLHQEWGYNTRAAGVSQEYALIPLDSVLVAWADEIVFASPSVYEEAIHNYPQLEGADYVTVLDIPDIYEWNNSSLRAAIIQQYAAKLEEKEDE